MDIVPVLIDTLTDPDEDVVDAARIGLQTISRKIEGLGPPRPSSPERRKEAAARWREWYAAIKPLDLDDEDNPDGAASRQSGTDNSSSGPTSSPNANSGSRKP